MSRGLVKVQNGATDCKSNVVCDALILDPESRSDTYPYIEVEEDDVAMEHEASVSKIAEEQLLYLMSRGLGEEEARMMVVSGFIEPITIGLARCTKFRRLQWRLSCFSWMAKPSKARCLSPRT